MNGGGDVDLEHHHIECVKTKRKRPPMYGVLLLNDDYTPMDFVVLILQHIFHKPMDEASGLMMQVHQRGSAVCGIYSRDVAETKADQVKAMAIAQSYPLQCVVKQM